MFACLSLNLQLTRNKELDMASARVYSKYMRTYVALPPGNRSLTRSSIRVRAHTHTHWRTIACLDRLPRMPFGLTFRLYACVQSQLTYQLEWLERRTA